MTLPAGYVGEHVDYGYACTVDTAQSATVDHSLFTPSTASSAERAREWQCRLDLSGSVLRFESGLASRSLA